VSSNILTVVIPTLNEEKGIQATIRKIPKKEIFEMGYELEVLVVDGNSTDSTRSAAEECGAKVIVEKNQGYGRAIRTGMTAASGEIVIVCDGDATYPIELAPVFIKHLIDKNLDFVTISRLHADKMDSMSLIHRTGNKILSASMKLLYSINIKDSQSGMFLMKRGFIDSINLISDHMSLSEEIKIIAFSFFPSDELDGKYYSRLGEAKLRTFRDGLSNLMFLFKFKKFLKRSLIQKRNSTRIANSQLSASHKQADYEMNMSL